MKEFHCGDVVAGCPHVVRAEQEDQLFEQISEHAREAHGIDEVPPEIVDAIHSKIVEV